VRRRAAVAAGRRGAEERRQREAEDEHLAVRTRLESAGDHDLFERLGEARGRLAAAGRAAASVEARAAAAARLLAAVDAARAAARRTYSEPLARTVEELGRPLFGDGFAVELDERLNVVRRTAGGVTLEVSRLSTGAQEQLALLLRLACAVLVSPAEGVPLVVDDALGHSDKARLRAMGEVLSRVGERCQVLVLTCFPERYADVAGARRLRLEGPPGAAGGDEPETMEECDE
jgi:DNA repair exonuclease SbcCD ATPase subunit